MFRGYLAPGRGFEVRWDGEHFVAVDVTASMKGEMCGLCMDYDDTTSDEFVLGPHASCLGLTTGAMVCIKFMKYNNGLIGLMTYASHISIGAEYILNI